ENRGDEVREGLAGAGARLGEHHAAALEDVRDGAGHLDLTGPRLEVRDRARERAVRREDAVDAPSQGDGSRLVHCPTPVPLYAGYNGNFRHSASTSARTAARTRSSSADRSARVIRSPITSMSASRIPRVVTAGVPMRMPLATMGGFLSNGMAFLLTVMPALPSAASATLPVMPFENTSTSIKWLSVPPLTRRKPAPVNAAASAFAFATICRWYSANAGSAASLKQAA